MKTTNFLKTIGLSILSFAIFSCSADEEQTSNTNNNNGGTINTGELKLFVIDSAKINTITPLGANENTILNRKVNTSSYISDLSISDNGSKLVYIDNQYVGTVMTNQLRIVNSDGSSDTQLVTSNTDDFLHVKYCTDNKIHYSRKNFTTNVLTFGTINADGTGLQESTGYYHNIVDITNDRKYLLLDVYGLSTTPNVQIIDLSLDGGAGGTYHTENFSGVDYTGIKKGTFTKDGKYAVIPYKDGSDIKIRIVDMTAKTSTTKTIVTGLTDWAFASVSMASDSARGVLTVMGGDYPTKTKSYLFSINNTTITNFQNNDDTVSDVFAY